MEPAALANVLANVRWLDERFRANALQEHRRRAAVRQQPGRVEVQLGWLGMQVRANPAAGRGRANNNPAPPAHVHWPTKLRMTEAESATLTEQVNWEATTRHPPSTIHRPPSANHHLSLYPLPTRPRTRSSVRSLMRL